jgi:hypothetical protein
VVNNTQVVAAHECKSLPPFPELLVSFLGILQVVHRWFDPLHVDLVSNASDGVHLAPSLFVGGASRALQSRMADALRQRFPVNMILGLHSFGWDIMGRPLRKLPSAFD